MADLFVYGTLQNPEIVRALTSKSFKQDKYVLSDYAVSLVTGEHFPGMTRSPGAYASGYILYDVDEESLEMIDKWEGPNYTPTNLSILVNDQATEVVAYIWADGSQLEGKWSNDTYRKTHMKECIEKCIPQEFSAPIN
jgi:gamma-glutamylcyclotransferase (GGCT)/AIG2-like uncharacterized protein YtfP